MASQRDISIVLKAVDEATKDIRKVRGELKSFSRAHARNNRSLESSNTGITRSFKNMAKVIGTAYATKQVVDFAKSSVLLAGNLEQQHIAFETMLGSAQEAKALLGELSTFASKTPFELVGIRQNAKQLLAMGISADSLLPTLKSLGDVSAGLSVPLERLALNYGQVIAQGKLTGKELRDFTVAGVPLLDELSSMLGKTKEQIQEMISAGEINADIMVDAFRNMSSEGGRFANLMDRQSKTLQGSRSNLQDEINQLKEGIGSLAVGPLTTLTGKVSDFVGSLQNTNQEIETSISRIQDLKNEIGNMTEEMKPAQEMVSEFSQLEQELSDQFRNGYLELEEYRSRLQDLTSEYKPAINSVEEYSKKIERSSEIVEKAEEKWVGLEKTLENLKEAHDAGKISDEAFMKSKQAILEQQQQIIHANEDYIDSIDSVGEAFGAVGDYIQGLPWQSYGLNAAKMLVGGLRSGMPSIVTASSGLADGIKDYLGFSSPTKKGPGSEADQWMPNFIKMIGEGLENGEDEIAYAAKNIATTMKDGITGDLDEIENIISDVQRIAIGAMRNISSDIRDQDNHVRDLVDEYGDLQDELTDIGKKGREEIASITEEIQNMKNEIANIATSGLEEVAQRGVDVEKRIEEIEKEIEQEGRKNELLEEQKKLRKELNLVKETVSPEDLEQARVESEKSETQKIIDRTALKKQEAEQELSELETLKQHKEEALEEEKNNVRKLMKEKKTAITSEFVAYKEMTAMRRKLDMEYFLFFGDEIKKQQQDIQETIRLMQSLRSGSGQNSSPSGNRAVGGTVLGGQSYRVGEKGPELFTPLVNGHITPTGHGGGGLTVTNTFGNITIANGMDMRQFKKRIESIFDDATKKYRLLYK